MLLTPPLSQTVTPSRTPSPSSVTYFMDGTYKCRLDDSGGVEYRLSTLIESSSLAGLSDIEYYPAIDQLETVVVVAQEHAGIYRFRTK